MKLPWSTPKKMGAYSYGRRKDKLPDKLPDRKSLVFSYLQTHQKQSTSNQLQHQAVPSRLKIYMTYKYIIASILVEVQVCTTAFNIYCQWSRLWYNNISPGILFLVVIVQIDSESSPNIAIIFTLVKKKLPPPPSLLLVRHLLPATTRITKNIQYIPDVMIIHAWTKYLFNDIILTQYWVSKTDRYHKLEAAWLWSYLLVSTRHLWSKKWLGTLKVEN